MKVRLLALSILLLAIAHNGYGQIITTVAGGDSLGLGDGGLAISCELLDPIGVAVDKSGNIYIADRSHNRIRMVNPAGIIFTIAGNGYGGYVTDNVIATATKINAPYGVAVDTIGNIYFVDALNNRIRKIDAAGIITTVAGNGTAGYGGDNGPATGAEINSPGGIAIDHSGNLFITEGNRVRKIGTDGTISTVAGNGIAGYNGDGISATAAMLDLPYGISVDNNGAMYIAEDHGNRVRKISITGIIYTIAGNGVPGDAGDNGSATQAQLHRAVGVVADKFGNVYIADAFNNRVKRIDGSGTIATYAGTGTSGYNGDGISSKIAELSSPVGLAINNNGDLYISDFGNNRIRRVQSTVLVGEINTANYQPSQNVNVFPNPATNTLFFRFPLSESATIKLLDITGMLMDQAVVHNSSQTSFDVQDYAPGLYLYQVITDDKIQSGKMLIGK